MTQGATGILPGEVPSEYPLLHWQKASGTRSSGLVGINSRIVGKALNQP